MNSRFVLKIGCRSATTARKLVEVLSPDNRGIPADQRFATSVTGRSVTLRVESEKARSGFSTVRSVLCDVALFREIWLISRNRSR